MLQREKDIKKYENIELKVDRWFAVKYGEEFKYNVLGCPISRPDGEALSKKMLKTIKADYEYYVKSRAES